MNENIDAKLTVQFIIKNCIDRETLKEEYSNNIEEWIRILLQEESIGGVVEDEYTILKVEEL